MKFSASVFFAWIALFAFIAGAFRFSTWAGLFATAATLAGISAALSPGKNK